MVDSWRHNQKRIRMINIGIIGTAGRKDDSDKITKELYRKMVELTTTTIYDRFNRGPRLVSGGAAVADHIAVLMFLARNDINPKMTLKLFLPRIFSLTECKFVETDKQYDEGKTANYYHQKFSEKCGFNSLNQIKMAIEQGANYEIGTSFKTRNTKVASESDVLFALTFGNGPKLKDGGTLDTMKKYQSKKGNRLTYHIDLHTLKIFNPAEI